MAQAPTVLLLATFGLEVVECGGALARNADAGGRSEAAVLLSSGQTFRRLFGPGLRTLLPEEASMDDAGVGLALHHHLDRAFHLYHGAGHHGRFLLAEPYRRQDLFHLDTLVV